MKIKVCGMRDSENITELVKLTPDYIGFIFYDKSKRVVTNFPEVDIPINIKKVGVFVNESIVKIVELVLKHQLNAVQLHGDETAEFCRELKRHPKLVSGSHSDEMLKQVQHDEPFTIIKAFSVDKNFDFSITQDYEPYCNLFIFDTKGKGYGGTGLKYDWNILKKYQGETPLLLSGGIGINDVDAVNKFTHSKFIGVDLNSGFEDAPALKNIEKLKRFISEINV